VGLHAPYAPRSKWNDFVMPSNCRAIKCGLICFWAIWFTVVFASNVCDALVQIGMLPANWPFASGNYAAIVKVTARYAVPSAVSGALFVGVILWDWDLLVLACCVRWATRWKWSRCHVSGVWLWSGVDDRICDH
jgi:hypothetical protein